MFCCMVILSSKNDKRGANMKLGDAEIKNAVSVERAQKNQALRRDNGSKDMIIWIMRLIGVLAIICGFVFGVDAAILGRVYIAIGLFGGLITIGMAEGIDLLQRIYVNTKK